jgi:hypothetical protein
MDQRKPRLLERLANLIPGYKGYADREQRREADQAVRAVVVSGLDSCRSAVDRIIADCSRSMQFAELERLETAKRRLGTLADGVRHAPAGYSGFFDRHQVGATELDAVYERDLDLAKAVKDLASRLSPLSAASDAAAAREMLTVELPGLTESLTQRDHTIEGI